MELGNLAFNTNKNQNYPCPEYVVALLQRLDKELCRVYWNKNQKEYDSPFQNTGNRFANNVFEVQAYSWNDDEHQQYNFKFYFGDKANIKDIEISWYKYLGRDTTVNQVLDSDIYVDMFNRCLHSILEMDKEDNDVL